MLQSLVGTAAQAIPWSPTVVGGGSSSQPCPGGLCREAASADGRLRLPVSPAGVGASQVVAGGSGPVQVKDSPLLLQQIEAMQLSIKHLKNENNRLKVRGPSGCREAWSKSFPMGGRGRPSLSTHPTRDSLSCAVPRPPRNGGIGGGGSCRVS